MSNGSDGFKRKVWITAYPALFSELQLTLIGSK